MHTLLTTDPPVAAAFIRQGEVAAFPTETVYGLGADVFNPTAIAKIFTAKERPADNPLIAHIAHLGQITALVTHIPESAQRLMAVFFPGPLTLVLPKADTVPSIATGGLDTIGVRMPAHPLAQALIAASQTPLVAPSANRSGRPSPTTWQAVHEDLNGRIACILKGAPSMKGLESTVVDCTHTYPLVLRPGMVILEDLQAVVPETQASDENIAAHLRSPGTRYRHYAPHAQVVLTPSSSVVPLSENCAFLGSEAPSFPTWTHQRVFTDHTTYAQALYAAFRESDRFGVDAIYCQTVPRAGLGIALMDRLERAARG